MGDTANSADVSPIIANYIVSAAGNDPQKQADLLAAARDGLLQVVNPQRISVVVPALPPGVRAQAAAAQAARIEELMPWAWAAQPKAPSGLK